MQTGYLQGVVIGKEIRGDLLHIDSDITVYLFPLPQYYEQS